MFFDSTQHTRVHKFRHIINNVLLNIVWPGKDFNQAFYLPATKTFFYSLFDSRFRQFLTTRNFDFFLKFHYSLKSQLINTPTLIISL